MALLGMKKKQAFGQMPQQVSPLQAYGDGSAMMQQPMSQQEQHPAKFKPNFLGVLGDAMQVFGGGQATYMQGVREQQERTEQMRQRAMQAQQERETGWQDYVREKVYERDNPPPSNNDTVNDVNWYMKASPEQREAFHKMNPIVQTMADGSQRLYDPTQSATPSFMPAPQGVTFTPIEGGQTARPSGNFRR